MRERHGHCCSPPVGRTDPVLIARILILSDGIVSCAVFFASFLCAIGFVGNYLLPNSIDVGAVANLGEAINIDMLLLSAFAIQHRAMAQPAFMRWWTGIIPSTCERSANVLFSSLLLLVSRLIPLPLWQVQGAPADAWGRRGTLS